MDTLLHKTGLKVLKTEKMEVLLADDVANDLISNKEMLVSSKISKSETDILVDNDAAYSTEKMSEKNSNEKEVVEEPRVGMTFDTVPQIEEFYRKFAEQEGFAIMKRSSKSGDDGTLKYFTFACSRQGNLRSQASIINSRPTARNNCPARINACLCADGRFKLTKVSNEHNHTLSPSKTQFFQCNKKLDSHAKGQLILYEKAGIRVNKNFYSTVVGVGGKEARDYIDKVRHSELGTGEAVALRNYFVWMRRMNDRFYYAMDLDDDCRLKNVFWADARSRAAYESFGDVVTFDTTFLTNKYKMPLASFIGVNHHGQPLLLACGLILNEDTSSFIWLFETLLACMSGCAPGAIISYQDKAIQNAIAHVFPRTRHRWCFWHTMKKISEKLSGYSNYHSIKKALEVAVYDSITMWEFEEKWGEMIKEYDLSNNDWMGGLYDERSRWVPCYVKDSFWAGMCTKQQTESLHAFFDGQVNKQTTLRMFLEQYNNTLRYNIEKEQKADYSSFSSVLPLITHYDIEKQFQESYTNEKFKEVQQEFISKTYCYPTLSREEGTIFIYQVSEEIKVKEMCKDVNFEVIFCEEGIEVKCNCCLFESRGILCRHILAVLTTLLKVKHVPEKYILKRWRKDIKCKHTYVENCHDIDSGVLKINKLCNSFYEAAEMVGNSDGRYFMVVKCLSELKEKLQRDEIVPKDVSQVLDISTSSLNDNYSLHGLSNQVCVLDPTTSPTKGLPPTKCKEPKVDRIVRKLKQANKTSHVEGIESKKKKNRKHNKRKQDAENDEEQLLPIAKDGEHQENRESILCKNGYNTNNEQHYSSPLPALSLGYEARRYGSRMPSTNFYSYESQLQASFVTQSFGYSPVASFSTPINAPYIQQSFGNEPMTHVMGNGSTSGGTHLMRGNQTPGTKLEDAESSGVQQIQEMASQVPDIS